MMNKKGQMGGVIALVVGIVAIVAVAIPVSQSVITSSNLTGITATIVGFIPVFLGLGGLAYAALSATGRK